MYTVDVRAYNVLLDHSHQNKHWSGSLLLSSFVLKGNLNKELVSVMWPRQYAEYSVC